MSKVTYFLEARFIPNKDETSTYLDLEFRPLMPKTLKTLRIKAPVKPLEQVATLIAISLARKFYTTIQVQVDIDIHRTKQHSKYVYDFTYKSHEFKNMTYREVKKAIIPYLRNSLKAMLDNIVDIIAVLDKWH